MSAATRYGNVAMERLINDILKLGGRRENLEIKLTGGGRVLAAMTTDIGARNIEFVRQYVKDEGFNVVGEDLGDIYPRKSAPWPAQLDRAGQATAHQHVSGGSAHRRQAVDRGGRIRRPAHHGGGAAACVVRRRLRHGAGGGRASATHRRIRPGQGHGRSAARPGHSARVLQADGTTEIVECAVLPINFACPNLLIQQGGERVGVSDAASPWSAAVAQA